MKKYVRYVLYGILLLISFQLWTLWLQEHPSKTNSSVLEKVTHIKQVDKQTDQTKPHLDQFSPSKDIDKKQLIQVHTNLFDVTINEKGGDIIQVAFKKYFKTIKKEHPLLLLNTKPDTFYVSQSGLYQSNGFRSDKKPIVYQSSQTDYQLKSNEKSFVVVLKGKNSEGLEVTKTYRFKQNKYAIGVDYQVKNATSQSWKGRYFAQFSQVSHPIKTGLFGMHAFQGIALLNHKKDYERYAFSKLVKEPLNESAQSAWLAMSQRYFVSAWIPTNSHQIYRYYSQTHPNHFYTAGFLSPQVVLKSGEKYDIQSKLYIGPKITSYLKQVAPKLQLTVDYSSITFLSLISSWLFKLLKFINGFIGNWGWSIIIITLLIKMVFYHLSATSYKSMAGMKKLQPKMEHIKERYKDNPQERNKAMMELYKKEKINPLGGCLPILVQIPVFIALYYVLLQSVELRHAPFILWIHDLSVKDPFYILPILMGTSMWVQQKLTPTASMDPMQAKMMLLLPIFLTVLFLNFPAGLVLYWLVNNLVSIAQQYYITKKFS